MPTLSKLLSKFNVQDRRILEFAIAKIITLDWYNLDIKKLKGYQDIFRFRRGKLRIIFIKSGNIVRIINIERRKETTYKI